MNKDLDRIVLNLTTDQAPAIPVVVAAREDNRLAVILVDSETGSETQITLFARQWKAVYQAIRWLARGDTPWPTD